ncbi:uncharacterized protein LOC143500017 isoform X2 [Brachyhypopomus gauderio]|uniref:uncharacterized protein LOC143500017 isoform X2 n=1 Tax=Brachyhypopomus gauderio TaxID=698409 RepID=UPI004043458E
MPWLANVDVSEQTRSRVEEKCRGPGREGDVAVGGGLRREVMLETEQTYSWKTLRWRCWPCWLRCLAPVAAVWSVVQQEAPLHPSVGLAEAGGRLWLAGLLWTCLGLGAALACLLRRRTAGPQQEKVTRSFEETVRQTGQAQEECDGQHRAGRLVAMSRALLDGLALSVLQEPLSEPSLTHLRGLLARLEAVSQAVKEGVLPDRRMLQASEVEEEEEEEEEEEDRMSEEESLLVARAKQICTYLQDRVSTLSSLLRVQAEYCVCVAGVQQGLQEHWEQLETLHSRVTLQPPSASNPDDPRTVLAYTQALEEEQEHLAATVGLAPDATWIKDFQQCNTEQFEKVYKDFTSLEQQTQTFVMHLKGLGVSGQERAVSTNSTHHNASPHSPLSSMPVYGTSRTGPFMDPEPSLRNRSTVSVMDCLCGLKRWR